MEVRAALPRKLAEVALGLISIVLAEYVAYLLQ